MSVEKAKQKGLWEAIGPVCEVASSTQVEVNRKIIPALVFSDCIES